MRKSKSSKLAPVLRAMTAFTAPAPAEPQCALADCDEPAAITCPCCNRRVCIFDIDGAVLDIPPGLCHECLFHCAGSVTCLVRFYDDKPAPVTCHRCGAVVDGDALTVQTAADGTPKLDSYLCQAHMEAFAERLKAAIRAQREGGE